jgi:glycosyltransferase involved in cell wall biosynthesis
MTEDVHGADHPSVAPGDRIRPRLAVLIPVFNDHIGLERSLASLAEDGARFDVFVVDDGSNPPIKIPPDLPYQVHLIRQEPNQGITAALNAGLAQIVTGGYEYIARLDACDLSLPGRFAAQLDFLDNHPDHAVVGTATRRVDTRGNFLFYTRPPVEHDAIMRSLRYRASITHASAMMRTQAVDACNCYRNLFPGGEDYDLWMRLGKRYRLANLNEVFLIVEVRQGSITARRQQLVLSRLRLLATHFDSWSPHSYLGVLANVVSLLTPRTLALRLRQRSWKDPDDRRDAVSAKGG